MSLFLLTTSTNMIFSEYQTWEHVLGQKRSLPSFRKKANKLVAADKSDLDPNSNQANKNFKTKQNAIKQDTDARDSTSEALLTDCSWEWSSGKSIDEADKSPKVRVKRHKKYWSSVKKFFSMLLNRF